MVPPTGREAFGHPRTRVLVETALPNKQPHERQKLASHLGELYTLRIDADYKPSVAFGPAESRKAVALLTTIFRLV
jgi:hypothetical protein